MHGHIFIAPGDITQLSADAIAFSSSNTFGRDGDLCSSFETHVCGFADYFRELRRGQALPCPVGSTFWLDLGSGRKPYGVVVVVSTGQSVETDKAGLAVRNAITTAIEQLRRQGRTDRLLVALPAFRVGKGGDRHQRLESACAQVRAATAALSNHPGVDVAFVTYTPALYRIFLDARRQVLGPPALGPHRHDALFRALHEGTCVLFVGAGLSSGAGLPGWNDLVARLSEGLNIHPAPGIEHLDVAQWYRERFGKERLAEVLRATFGAPGLPTLAHYLLMALPLRHVITTNYDHLLERALTALKRHPVPVIRQEDVAHTGGAGVYVVKLHGDAAVSEEVVLTRDDYDEFFERRPAMALLLEGLLLNQTFFFVGYSLRDPNFRQIFSRIARMLREARRPAFATSFEAKGDTAKHLQGQWARKQLELIPIPGRTVAEQENAFLRFLDGLADEITTRSAPLALAPDVPAPAPRGRLRGLLEKVGAEVEALCQEPLDACAVHLLAELLDLLTRHGWRPGTRGGRNLSRLWQQLADRAGDAELRRRLLIAALGHAEALADAHQVRDRLAAAPPAPAGEPGEAPTP